MGNQLSFRQAQRPTGSLETAFGSPVLQEFYELT